MNKENKSEQYAQISLDVLTTLRIDVAIPFSFGITWRIL